VAADPDELLTISQVVAELQIGRATFYRWRHRGAGPPSIRLPNGSVRIRRAALTDWLGGLEDDDRKENAA